MSTDRDRLPEYRVVVLSVETGKAVIDQQVATNANDAASWAQTMLMVAQGLADGTVEVDDDE